ncbi:MAG: acetyl-CoA carboxylase biotin carboxyl carrier protein [Planctomycetota bacterium]
MDAQVEQIQRVIDVMVSAGAVEVELEDGATKLRVRLKDDQPQLALPAASFSAPAMSAMNDVGANVASKTVAGAADAGVGHAGGQPFQSPMVGTFYRSPSPDAEPFAKVGDHVGPDSVICIIEAMKVMNEIRAETEGEVVEVLAQNGEPVDYGQPLFVIRS